MTQSLVGTDHATDTLSTTPDRVVAGAGFAFVLSVIVQNILRASAPAPDASAAQVVEHFSSHRAAEWTLVVVFVIGAAGLTTFLGGLWTHLVEGPAGGRTWARTGILGTAGILALFPLLVACEVGLLVSARRTDLAAAVPVLWLLHNSVFAVLTLFIGIALFGLSRASVLADLVPGVVGWIGAVGAALLALNTVFAPIGADRSSAVMAFGLAGFLCWLVFVVAASWGINRSSARIGPG